MKKVLYLIILLFFAYFTSVGQNENVLVQTKYYQLTAPTYVKDNSANGKSVLARERLIFTVIKTDSNGDRQIQFWKFNDADKPNIINDNPKLKNDVLQYNYNNLLENSEDLNKPDNTKVFLIGADDFEENAVPYYNAGFKKGACDWSSGIAVLPIKVRKNPDFTFSKDFTLGISAGGKMRISHLNPTFVNFLFNVGISSVTLDGPSTLNKVTTPSERSAYTTAIGLVFENHSFQFGLFYGKDRLSKNDFENSNWIYNNKPWLSIGIGYQLFSSNKVSSNSTQGNNK